MKRKTLSKLIRLRLFFSKKIEKLLFKSAFKIITLSKKSVNIICKNFNIKKKMFILSLHLNKKNYKISKMKDKKFKFLYLGSAKILIILKSFRFFKIFDEYIKNWHFTAFSIHKIIF